MRAIITDILGDRVVIGESELQHSIAEHFENLPENILLELIELVLNDPTFIFEETRGHFYHLVYRLDSGKHIVVVIKKSESGVFFSTVYPTGKSIRNKHKKLRKVNP